MVMQESIKLIMYHCVPILRYFECPLASPRVLSLQGWPYKLFGEFSLNGDAGIYKIYHVPLCAYTKTF